MTNLIEVVWDLIPLGVGCLIILLLVMGACGLVGLGWLFFKAILKGDWFDR
jgi:hypothetical protein